MVTEFSVAKIDVGCGKKTKINHAAQRDTGNPTKIKRILRGVSGQLLKKDVDARPAWQEIKNMMLD